VQSRKSGPRLREEAEIRRDSSSLQVDALSGRALTLRPPCESSSVLFAAAFDPNATRNGPLGPHGQRRLRVSLNVRKASRCGRRPKQGRWHRLTLSCHSSVETADSIGR